MRCGPVCSGVPLTCLLIEQIIRHRAGFEKVNDIHLSAFFGEKYAGAKRPKDKYSRWNGGQTFKVREILKV